jgi:Uma2 family endonuclease
MATQPVQHPITVAEYYRMAADGVLHENDRVELIEGSLHWMSPIGSPHAACINYLAFIFIPQLGRQAVVITQNPIHLDDLSEPQPDVTLARWRDDHYRAAHPIPADVLLLIEVADSTLKEDRRIKAPLYARHDIPELWIVNLLASEVEVYTQPQNGRYQQRVVRRRGEQVAPEAFPDLRIVVDEIFG